MAGQYTKPIPVPLPDTDVWEAFSDDYDEDFTLYAEYIQKGMDSFWSLRLAHPDGGFHEMRLHARHGHALETMELLGRGFGGWRKPKQ